MRSTINTEKKCRNNAGFTLIEMAIVITIIGLIAAAATQLLLQRQKHLRAEDTRIAVAQATEAIADFRNTYGRYPCPASLIAVQGNATYGLESDCTDTSIAISSGVDATDGVSIVAGLRAPITYNDRSTDPPTPVTNNAPRVRVGALPFKNLNMDERDSYDGYRNRIIYAISEHQGVSDTFEGEDGVIGVLNDQGASVIQPANSAHFIIFSTGENGAGGYTQGGARLACAGTSQESENCDFDVDAVFQHAQTSTMANGSATTFDDQVSYMTHRDVPLWEKDPTGTGGNDVAMKPTGGLGVGPTSSNIPTEDFQVEGIIKAQDDPTTPAQEGNIESENICDYASGTTTCFPSSLIAGDLTSGGGMECPPGEFMVGIQNNAPICTTEVRVTCPAGLIAVGIQADGSLDCNPPPLPGCPTTNVNICGETHTLFAAAHGTVTTLGPAGTNVGNERYQRYRCNAGTWTYQTGWGMCSCTTASGSINSQSCASWSACGNRFTGTRDVQWQRACPSGSWSLVTISDSCVCDTTSRTRNISCPSNFNDPVGRIMQTNTHNCSTTPPSCSGWIETGRTCTCTPERQTRTRSCPGGLTGSYQEERFFNCPSGPTNPGSWTGWTEVTGQTQADNCSCVPSNTTVNRNDCHLANPGYVGYRVWNEDYACPSPTNPPVYTETMIDDSNCAPPPPISCTWVIQGASGSYDNKINPVAGTQCFPGSEDCTGSVTCSDDLGGGQWAYGNCTCQ